MEAVRDSSSPLSEDPLEGTSGARTTRQSANPPSKKGGKSKGKSKTSKRDEVRCQRALDKQFEKTQREAARRAAQQIQQAISPPAVMSPQTAPRPVQEADPLPIGELSPNSEGSEVEVEDEPPGLPCPPGPLSVTWHNNLLTWLPSYWRQFGRALPLASNNRGLPHPLAAADSTGARRLGNPHRLQHFRQAAFQVT